MMICAGSKGSESAFNTKTTHERCSTVISSANTSCKSEVLGLVIAM